MITLFEKGYSISNAKTYQKISPKNAFLKTRRVVLPSLNLPFNKYPELQTSTVKFVTKFNSHTHHDIFKCAIGAHDFNFRSLLFGRLLIQEMLMIITALQACLYKTNTPDVSISILSLPNLFLHWELIEYYRVPIM